MLAFLPSLHSNTRRQIQTWSRCISTMGVVGIHYRSISPVPSNAVVEPSIHVVELCFDRNFSSQVRHLLVGRDRADQRVQTLDTAIAKPVPCL